MPINVTINNQTFQYPAPGDSPGWGAEASDTIVAIAEALAQLLGPNDIPQTTFSIQNNISSFTNIANLIFNTGQVRGATVQYTIYRTSDTNPSGKAESGTINLVYDNSAASDSKWAFTVFGVTGNSGVTFSITDLGQFQYKSTDIGSAGYSGVMTFAAKALVY